MTCQGKAIRPWTLLWLVGWCVSWAPCWAATQAEVTILSPALGQPLFDQVNLEVEVQSTLDVTGVVFSINGQEVGTVERPPYRLAVDVGPENRDRLIEVVVHSLHGPIAQTRRLAEAVRVDDVVDLGLQQLYVSVSRSGGQRVLDLTASDFTVRDEGTPQEIVTFASGDIPFTAILMIDGSFSMSGGPLDAALRGVRHFVRDMANNDRAKVLVTSDHVVRATPWARHPEVLTEALESTQASGGSAVLDHLFLALELLEAEQGRRVVILLSDGWDLHSVLKEEQVREIARRSQAMVYWVRLGVVGTSRATSERSPTGWVGTRYGRRNFEPVSLSTWRDGDASKKIFRQLEAMVDDSGGRIVEVDHLSDIEGAFGEILQELREQIALGYYPNPRRQDGSWRRVRVKLQRQGLELRTRKGYVDRRRTP